MILLTFCDLIPCRAFNRLLTGKNHLKRAGNVTCHLSCPLRSCCCSYYRYSTWKLYNFKRASLIPELRFFKRIYKRIMNCVTSLGTVRIPCHVLFVHFHYRKTLSSEINLCTLQFSHTHTPKIRASISQNPSSIHGRRCKSELEFN